MASSHSNSENRARQAGTFLGMTDPRLDFVPADLMAPGEIGPVCGSVAALCGTFVLGLPVFTNIVVRSFGMNGCMSADVILSASV